MIDPLISKRQQLLLATQLCRMVLKVRYRSFLSCFISRRTVFITRGSPARSVSPTIPQQRHGCTALPQSLTVRIPRGSGSASHSRTVRDVSSTWTMSRTVGETQRSHGVPIGSIDLLVPSLLASASNSVCQRAWRV